MSLFYDKLIARNKKKLHYIHVRIQFTFAFNISTNRLGWESSWN